MRLSLHCMGGFTGPAGAQSYSVDLADLPQAKAAHVQKLLDAVDLPHQPASLLKTHPQPWDFRYTLTVDNGARRQLCFHTDAAPPALCELVEVLRQNGPDEVTARPSA